MKTLRIWLLVLLAVLLPIRGAVAAAMPCAFAGMPHKTGAAATHVHVAGMTDAGHDHAVHVHAHAHASAGPGDRPAGGTQTCNLCCDFCSMTTLPSSLAALPPAPDFATLSFPDLFAPLPSFLSEGQERPPRST